MIKRKIGTINHIASVLSKHSGASKDMVLTTLKRNKFKYCTGKYDPSGKNKPHDKDSMIWYESRRDEWGPHIILYTVYENDITNKLTEIYLENTKISKEEKL